MHHLGAQLFNDAKPEESRRVVEEDGEDTGIH
jgi:hypothetical protein